MFESSNASDVTEKKKKALLYAAIVTFVIAILYVSIWGRVYRFSAKGQDFSGISSLFRDTGKAVEENISKGTSVIKNKEN